MVVETDFEPGLSSWAHKATREKADAPEQPLPLEWVKEHGWYWDGTKLKEIVNRVGNKPVFFVGGAHNEKDFYDLFDKRFGLFVDTPTLISRLQLREPDRWVDGSQELLNLIAWNEKSKDYNAEHGAIPIDSSQPVEQVADVILRHIEG